MSTAAGTCVVVRFDTLIHFLTKPQLFLLLFDLIPTVFNLFSGSAAFINTEDSSLGERDIYCVAGCFMLPWQASRHFIMLKLHLFLKAAALHVAHVHYVRRTLMYSGGLAIYRILRHIRKKALLSGRAAKSTYILLYSSYSSTLRQ